MRGKNYILPTGAFQIIWRAITPSESWSLISFPLSMSQAPGLTKKWIQKENTTPQAACVQACKSTSPAVSHCHSLMWFYERGTPSLWQFFWKPIIYSLRIKKKIGVILQIEDNLQKCVVMRIREKLKNSLRQKRNPDNPVQCATLEWLLEQQKKAIRHNTMWTKAPEFS